MDTRIRVGLLVAITTAAAVGGVTALSHRRVGGFSTGDPLLVADVANTTGDSMFDHAAQVAALVSLRQSAHVSLYPRSRVRNTLQLMTVSNLDTALNYELAQDVAERDHVRFVLGVWLDRIAGDYRVTARLADVAAHRDVFEATGTARTRDAVLGVLDDLLRRTRRALGESRRDIASRSAPLPRVTTPSLEALRAYALGTRVWEAGDYKRAREFWQRAVDLDTGFAMAYAALGSYAYYVHDREGGDLHTATALARASRLTEWERLQLLQRRASFRGIPDSALALGRVIAQRFPSATSWYNVGTSAMQGKRHQEAIDAFHRALGFDSLHVLSWLNLATTYNSAKRYEEAIRAYRRAAQIDSVVLYRNFINHEFGAALVQLRRNAEAESAYQRMVAGPRLEDRALGMRSLGLLALWEGRMYDAIGHFQQAVDATQQMRSMLSVGRNRLWLATAYRAVNRTAEANAELSKAIALGTSSSFPPVMLAVLAHAAYQHDRRHDVEALVKLIHGQAKSDIPSDRASMAVGDALIYLVRQRPDSAVTRLRASAGFNFPLIRLALTAEALQAAGQQDSAKTTLLALLAEDGFGVEGQDDYSRAPMLLGDVLLQLGDTSGAVKRYQESIDRWRAAPADLPDLVAARARLAAITRPVR